MLSLLSREMTKWMTKRYIIRIKRVSVFFSFLWYSVILFDDRILRRIFSIKQKKRKNTDIKLQRIKLSLLSSTIRQRNGTFSSPKEGLPWMFEFPKGEQRLSFYRPSPPLPHRYISIFSFPFFFFPLPSLSRKRDKHERAGIDLFEALHEHQQRSRNKRVEDPPKRASPSRYRLSLLPTRSSPNLSVFSDPWLFSKEPPVYVGGPRLSTLPSCHFAYIQTHAIHRPLFVPFSFQYSFFPSFPLLFQQ